jgi:hypothetical protein
MKKWLVTASIIVIASSALCLPVRAEPRNETVLSAPSVEAWWIDIEGRRAFGTVSEVKPGELKDRLLDPATMSLVTPAGALHDLALFSPFAAGTQEAPAVPLASFEDDRGLTARSIANLYIRGVELSIAYAFDGIGAKNLTDVVTIDPRPVRFQGPIGAAPLVAQGE